MQWLQELLHVYLHRFIYNSYSSECFFHSLPVWYSLLVYECHQLMNYAGHPAHCFIFHDIIVVFTVLWSCPISLLLTCFWVKGIIVYWFFHRCSQLVHWTKLFWTDVISYKNKTSQGTSIIFFRFEFFQIPHMGKYFRVDHARRTCITAYPNMVTKSQRYAKSCDFQEKKNN